MERFEFYKLMLESANPPTNKNMLWVDVDEATKKVKTVKEFENGNWVTILNNDKVDVSPVDEAIIVEVNTMKTYSYSVDSITEGQYDATRNFKVTVKFPTCTYTSPSTFTSIRDGKDECDISVKGEAGSIIRPVKIVEGSSYSYATLTHTITSDNNGTQSIKFISGTSIKTASRTCTNGTWGSWTVA